MFFEIKKRKTPFNISFQNLKEKKSFLSKHALYLLKNQKIKNHASTFTSKIKNLFFSYLERHEIILHIRFLVL